MRTSIDLFIDYLKNCETIEIVIVSDNTHQIVGTAQVTDLLDIFEGNNYSRYFPILNEFGNRLGDIRVSLKLTSMAKGIKSFRKGKDFHRNQFRDRDNCLSLRSKYGEEKIESSKKMLFDNKSSNIFSVSDDKYNNDNDVYKSILKDKRMQADIPLKKFNTQVADKLVAQVVARAQRLRGAILKESYDKDPLVLSESSILDSPISDEEVDNEAKLYEYFLGVYPFSRKSSTSLITL